MTRVPDVGRCLLQVVDDRAELFVVVVVVVVVVLVVDLFVMIISVAFRAL